MRIQMLIACCLSICSIMHSASQTEQVLREMSASSENAEQDDGASYMMRKLGVDEEALRASAVDGKRCLYDYNYAVNAINALYGQLQEIVSTQQQVETTLNRFWRRVAPVILAYGCYPHVATHLFTWSDELSNCNWWDTTKLGAYLCMVLGVGAYELYDIGSCAYLDSREDILYRGVQQLDDILQLHQLRMMQAEENQEQEQSCEDACETV